MNAVVHERFLLFLSLCDSPISLPPIRAPGQLYQCVISVSPVYPVYIMTSVSPVSPAVWYKCITRRSRNYTSGQAARSTEAYEHETAKSHVPMDGVIRAYHLLSWFLWQLRIKAIRIDAKWSVFSSSVSKVRPYCDPGQAYQFMTNGSDLAITHPAMWSLPTYPPVKHLDDTGRSILSDFCQAKPFHLGFYRSWWLCNIALCWMASVDTSDHFVLPLPVLS